MESILQEIQAVLAGMKRNAKWKRLISANLHLNGIIASTEAATYAPTDTTEVSREESIILAFIRLKSILESGHAVNTLKGLDIVHPFLLLITYPDTTGPITGLALSSVERLMRFRIFDSCVDTLDTLMGIVHSTTHCKFEATDAASDEVVLLRILQILQLSMESKYSRFLSDELVCGMLECAFSMCFQMRLSHCLRKSAEMSIINILCKVIDTCLSVVTSTSMTAVPEPAAAEILIHNTNEIAVTPTTPIYHRRPSEVKDEEEFVHVSPQAHYDGFKSNGNLNVLPFGVPTVREVLRFTAALLDISDQHNTESMRLIALNVFQALIEYGHKLILSSSALIDCLPGATTNLLRLLKFSRQAGNILLYSTCVHACNCLFGLCNKPLMEYYEYYLSEIIFSGLWSDIFYIFQPNNEFVPMKYEKYESYALDILPKAFLDPSEPTYGFSQLIADVKPRRDKVVTVSSSVYEEVLQLLWESLYQQMRNEKFAENVFIRYDCNQFAKDLLHELMRLMCHSVICKSLNHDVLLVYNKQENTGYYDESQETQRDFGFGTLAAMDLMSCFLTHLLKRVSEYGYELSPKVNHDEQENDLVSSLKQKRLRKACLSQAGILFDESESSAFSFLLEHGIIISTKPEELGKILHEIPNMKKKRLGEYLGKPKNVDTLQVFIDEFHWEVGIRIDEALRSALTKFRLPGEAQQIERVVKAFSTSYFDKCVAPLNGKEVPVVKTEDGPKEEDIKSADAAFVLSYAIVMLNTDQHNPQVLRRMKNTDFIKNLRGVNDGVNFRKEYLEQIYDAIKSREIIIPEERADENNDIVVNDYSSDVDSVDSESDLIGIDVEVFKMYHRWIATSVLYINRVATSRDDVVFNKTTTLYYQLCNLAFCYGMENVLHQLISAFLQQINFDGGRTRMGQSITHLKHPILDSLRDYKTQIQLVIFFRVLNDFGNLIHDKAIWGKVFDVIYKLFDANIITFETYDFFFARPIRFPKIFASELPPMSPPNSAQPDVGLFSAISSFLMASSYGPTPTESNSHHSSIIDEEVVEYESGADEFIRNAIDDCKLELLLNENVKHYDFMPILDCLVDERILTVSTEGPVLFNLTQQANEILFRILMCAKLLKTTNKFLEVQRLLGFLSKLSADPSQYHFVVEKYTFYATLDLLRHVVSNPGTQTSKYAWDILDCMDLVAGNLLQAKFKVNYEKNGLHNVQFHDSITLYIYSGIMNVIPPLLTNGIMSAIPPRLGDDDRPVVAKLTEFIKNVILRTNGFHDNVKLLQKAWALHGLIRKKLDSLENVQILSHLIQLYSFTYSVELPSTRSASVIAQKLSNLNEEVGTSPSLKPTDIFQNEFRGIAMNCSSMLYEILETVNKDDEEVWGTAFLPVLNALGEAVWHPCKETRTFAMTLLQKGCVDDKIPRGSIPKIFQEVLFPLLQSIESIGGSTDNLISQTSVRSEEIKFRCASLLCKLFLHYLHDFEEHDISAVWAQILHILKRYHSAAVKALKSQKNHSLDRKPSSQELSDYLSLVESIPESIKNMVLVMSTSGIFSDQVDSQNNENELWLTTWEIVDPWLPHIKTDLFPEKSPQPLEGKAEDSPQGDQKN